MPTSKIALCAWFSALWRKPLCMPRRRTNYFGDSMSRWTPERRAKQSAAIHRWAPWTRATGPRTINGKARSSRNAWKGSNRAWWRAVDTILKHNLWETNKPLAQRVSAALATYERLHPDRLRAIWIYASDPSSCARTAQEFRALYPTARITVLAARVAPRANRPRAQS